LIKAKEHNLFGASMMKTRTTLIALLVIIALFLVGSAAYAQGLLDIPWWTTDGGGGLSQGGNYTLHGTAGQPDAAYSQGGSYTLSGGFWPSRSIIETDTLERVFLPLTEK
jgi:hypothetical protein